MSGIDNEIVSMKFENSQFERAVSTSISTMDRLKKALLFTGADKGLDKVSSSLNKFGLKNPFSVPQKGITDLNNTANRFTTGRIEGGITSISKKFIALSTIGVTALSTLTQKAIATGTALVKSVTLDPIMAGFRNYETQIKAVQTILANTATSGTKLKDVTRVLGELNEYANKTVYNFSEMAKNIGTFTAAGVGLDESAQSIKGIANLAALSGSNSQQASTAMYQLSQAIAAGRVSLMDWNSVVNAGLGGKTFQNALVNTARASGVAIDDLIKKSGSFRNSLQEGWLTSNILTKTLAQFTGDLTAKQIKAMGFTDKEAKAILAMGKRATDAATKIKTMSQLTDALREEVASAWGAIFTTIFGNINQATKLFSAIHDVAEGALTGPIYALNNMLIAWKKLGGRTVLIKGLVSVFQALSTVVTQVGKAFGDVFPKATGQDLFEITKAFRRFADSLIPSKETAEGLRKTFGGIFAVLHIGYLILKGVLGYFLSLFGLLATGSGSIFQLTGSIGDLFIRLNDFFTSTDIIDKFFNKIEAARAAVLAPVIAFVYKLIRALAGLITAGADKFVDWMQALAPVIERVVTKVNEFKDLAVSAIGPFVKALGELVSTGADAFFEKLSNAAENIGPVLSSVGGTIKKAFSGLAGSAKGLNFGSIFDFGGETSAASAGLSKVSSALKKSAGLADVISRAWGKVKEAFSGIADNLAPIGQAILGVFDIIKTKIQDFVAGMGIQDALALINTGFFIALYITFRKFLGSFTGVIGSLQETFEAAAGTLNQVTSNLKTMQTSVRANIILKIAAALLLLAVALLILSKIPARQLAAATLAVASMLTQLVTALIVLESTTKTFVGAARVAILGAALIGLGVAILLLSVAVKVLGNMDIKTLAKGIGSIAVVLGLVVGAIAILSKTGGAGQLILAAAALGILAGALLVFAGAVKLYASINTATLLEGGIKIVATLAALGLVMKLFPPGMVATSVGILVVAGALIVMAGALKLLGGLTVEEIAKSLITMALALGILAIAMAAMAEGLPGAAAMLVMAAALVVLVPPLQALGSMSLKEIGLALLALAGVFVVLGLAGAVLGPLAPIIVGLAGAIALLGIGVAAVGAGLFLFATGLATLAVSGAAGAAILVAAVISIAETIPIILQQFGLGLIAFAKVIATAGPPLVAAFSTLLTSILRAVIKNTPVIGRAIQVMLLTALRVIRNTFPAFVTTGVLLLMTFLRAVEKNIGQITGVVSRIIIKFLRELAKYIPRITEAGVDLILAFIRGLSQAIDNHSGEMGEAGRGLGGSIIKGIIGGLSAGLSSVVGQAIEIAKSALAAAKKALGIKSPSREFRKVGEYMTEGWKKGLDDTSDAIPRTVHGVAKKTIDAANVMFQKLPQSFASDVKLNPRIRPVLDLTDVKNNAGKIGEMFGAHTVRPDVAYAHTVSISESQGKRNSIEDIKAAIEGRQPVRYELKQYNNSPKALSAIEIYRNTRNLLSLTKEVSSAK